ncbi:protein patched homolog 1 [Arapaima gigas]
MGSCEEPEERKYFFAVLAILTILGVLNGLVLLPVLLSYFGPYPEVSPVDGQSQLSMPQRDSPPRTVHFATQPATTGSDSSDSEYTSNTTASGLSEELQHYIMWPTRGRYVWQEEPGQYISHSRPGGQASGRARRTEPQRVPRSASNQPDARQQQQRLRPRGGPPPVRQRETGRTSQQQPPPPPPHRPRTDAFESAADCGSRSGSSYRNRTRQQSHSHSPHAHAAFDVPGPSYGEPITMVTASASVTVAVHPARRGQNPTRSTFSSPDGYQPADAEEPEPPFSHPHVPFDGFCDENSKVEAIELQDVECEAQSKCSRTSEFVAVQQGQRSDLFLTYR